MKKDNKGFSLVELIVVVLIMGILAVALTPQVMKWVNNSRIANDNQLMETVVSNLQLALANENAYAEATRLTDAKEITINNTTLSGLTLTNTKPASATSNGWIDYKFSEISGTTTATDFKTKQSGKTITIHIYSTGKVDGSYDGGSIND